MLDCHIKFSVRNCMLPSGCTVFQGEPNPISQYAGHWDCWLATSMRIPCQPIEAANCNGSGVQHSLLICARTTRRIKPVSKPDEKSQLNRLGSGIPIVLGEIELVLLEGLPDGYACNRGCEGD